MKLTIDTHHHILPDFFWRETNDSDAPIGGLAPLQWSKEACHPGRPEIREWEVQAVAAQRMKCPIRPPKRNGLNLDEESPPRSSQLGDLTLHLAARLKVSGRRITVISKETASK
jgi:hypothetical protein